MNISGIKNSIRIFPAVFFLALSLPACTQNTSEAKGLQNGGKGYEMSGRTSMNRGDATQCLGGDYDKGSDTAKGHPIAGVDGSTLGTMYDAKATPDTAEMCGKCVKISKGDKDFGTYTVADRIWQNDGVNGQKYGNNDKGNADKKTGGIGAGNSQIDISRVPYEANGWETTTDVTLQETGC